MKFFAAHQGVLAIVSLVSSSYATPTFPNSTTPSPFPKSNSGYQTAAYYVNWAIYGRNHPPQQIPATRLSHVLYAFANVSADGSISLTDPWADIQIKSTTDSLNETGTNMYGNLKQLFIHKQANRKMKTLLSVGGWSLSTYFSAAASTEATRAQFAITAVQMVRDLGFDGIDVDWEYPETSIDAENFVLLLAATRRALDAYAAEYVPGHHFLLTVACPAGPKWYNTLRLKEMDAYLDARYLMAYDFSGSWDTRAGHNANVYPSTSNNASTPFSSDRAISDYIAAGVPAHKLVMGMPLYGRSFQSTSGIGQIFNGTGGGTWEAGTWDYKILPKTGATEFLDKQAIASWTYDNRTRELISYDTPVVAALKGRYVMRRGLGGGMWWETSYDKIGEEESLIATVARTFRKLEASENCLSYPGSIYDNLRAGMP